MRTALGSAVRDSQACTERSFHAACARNRSGGLHRLAPCDPPAPHRRRSVDGGQPLGRPQSINRLCDLISGPKVHLPKRPGEPDCTWADVGKIDRVLDWRSMVSFEEGTSRMLDAIEHWSQAPVWTPESIAGATADWFKYLGKRDPAHESALQHA